MSVRAGRTVKNAAQHTFFPFGVADAGGVVPFGTKRKKFILSGAVRRSVGRGGIFVKRLLRVQ